MISDDQYNERTLVMGVDPAGHCGSCDKIFRLTDLNEDGLCGSCSDDGKRRDAEDEAERLRKALSDIALSMDSSAEQLRAIAYKAITKGGI